MKMGVWGTGIFDEDEACEVRDHYRQLIEDRVDDAEATQSTLEKFKASFDNPDYCSAAIVALAVTQSKIGRLDPSIRDRALAWMDQGADLDIWTEDSPKDLGKRKAALEKARLQITGPQPTRKRIRRPRLHLCDLVAGDVLALDLPAGPVLFRTVQIESYRLGEIPILEELEFDGPEVPEVEIIEQLPARDLKKCGRVLWPDGPFRVTDYGTDPGWSNAGFRKVAKIPTRLGDETLKKSMVEIQLMWHGLAEEFQNNFDL